MTRTSYLRKGALLCLTSIFIGSGLGFNKTVPGSYKFDIPEHFPPMRNTGNNEATVAGAELGRALFYDPILSGDSTISCNSCHRQDHAFSDAPNSFSKGTSDIKQSRNTPSLFNLAWQPSFFWDGKVATLEEQVLHPVRNAGEMNLDWKIAAARLNNSRFYRRQFGIAFGDGTIDSTAVAKALAQFLRTIVSCNSKYDRVLQGKAMFTREEAEGFILANDMTKGDCLHCHTTDADPLGTTFAFSNNGHDTFHNAEGYTDKGRGAVTGNKSDNGKFKIPSLRNVALTAPYMHDGRFKTLEEVIDFYSDGVNDCANVDSKMEFSRQHGAHLTKQEKQQILSFLHTLTDSVMMRDKRFGSPFKRN